MLDQDPLAVAPGSVPPVSELDHPSDPAPLVTFVPGDKHDVAAVARASSAGWPVIEPVVPQLIEWVQDINWPVAAPTAELLASIGEPLAPYLRSVLAGDDPIWKYWLILFVLQPGPLGLVRLLRPELGALATDPTADDRAEEVDVEAAALLARLGDESTD